MQFARLSHVQITSFALFVALAAGACGGDEGGGDSGDGDTSGSGSGSITIDGVTYEVDTVLDCTIGNEGAPDDRQFVGRSADGSTEFSVGYFGEDNEFGLNGIDLEAEVDGNDWTFASSYAGTDGTFEVTLTDDGAEGTATVRAVGIDAPDADFEATWSFSCTDPRG